MKVLFLSFVVGLGVGVLYGLIRVKSPAPPIVALLGLLGMVLGEQLGIWIQTKKLDVPACRVRLPCRRALRPAASIRNALAVSGPRLSSELSDCQFRRRRMRFNKSHRWNVRCASSDARSRGWISTRQ